MKAAVAGAGIGGLTAAIALRLAGHEVTVAGRDEPPAADSVHSGLRRQLFPAAPGPVLRYTLARRVLHGPPAAGETGLLGARGRDLEPIRGWSAPSP